MEENKKQSLALAYSIKRKAKFGTAPIRAEAVDIELPSDFADEAWDDLPDEELEAAPESKEERVARIMQGFRTKGLNSED